MDGCMAVYGCVWLCMAVWLYIQRVSTRVRCMAMYGDVWAGTTFHKWIKSVVTVLVRAHRTHRHCIEVSTHTGYASVSDSRPSRMLPATTFSLSGNPYMLYGTHTATTRVDTLYVWHTAIHSHTARWAVWAVWGCMMYGPPSAKNSPLALNQRHRP